MSVQCQNLTSQSKLNFLIMLTREYREIFRTSPGWTAVAHHYCWNSYKKTSQTNPGTFQRWSSYRQLQIMVDQGIIEESNNPWMAPARFVRKKTGDLWLCIDYQELNKKITIDVYLLPLTDQVQDRLPNSFLLLVYRKILIGKRKWQNR